ncbi:hypothetical protein [Desulfuromonas sp. CSMB_57]|jgi:hypothetical protein|uniref:hypothetical protein n=1 Tax=Desulfuromonas sp. CSMB_57 TaxID=2807629 RepID=UPI001CD4FD2B|nr:hypothetical protein [Desulfuromonas sp. CSMB_57]
MSVPEILLLETQLQRKAFQKRKVQSDIGASISDCKQAIADIMRALKLVNRSFSGKLVIAFKEGGVSYIERVEQLK